ncbi:hypothetical protein, partial [Oceanobacillus luteolus]
EIAPHTILALLPKLPSLFQAFRYALYSIQLIPDFWVSVFFIVSLYEREPEWTSRILIFLDFIEWYVLSLLDTLVSVQ